MDNLDFLSNDLNGSGNAALTILLPDQSAYTINNLDLDIIEAACPLLALCFETGYRGPHHSMEASSTSLVISFLRFLYAGEYLIIDAWGKAEPCSLLLHAELCRMGDMYEVPTLLVQSHCNIIQGTELACSNPEPPKDLCAAIRYIYENLSNQRQLIETVLHYCVNCFLQHGLPEDEDFRKLAYELRPFHNDLCRTNFRRGFKDDGAMDIIRLPVRDQTESKTIAEQRAALGDFLYDLWGESPTATPLTTPHFGPSEPAYTVVHHPRKPYKHAAADDSDGSTSDSSMSEAEGFSLVHRPKTAGTESEDAQSPVNMEVKDIMADVFADTETGWLGVEEPRAKQMVGLKMCTQPSLADSTATIRPPFRDSLAHGSDADDDWYSSDSGWSVVEISAAKARSLV